MFDLLFGWFFIKVCNPHSEKWNWKRVELIGTIVTFSSLALFYISTMPTVIGAISAIGMPRISQLMSRVFGLLPFTDMTSDSDFWGSPLLFILLFAVGIFMEGTGTVYRKGYIFNSNRQLTNKSRWIRKKV